MELGLIFSPLLPWPVVAVLAAVAVAGVSLALWYRLSGWWLRLLAYSVLVLALAGPQLKQEQREGLANVAFLVVDRSASTSLEDRMSPPKGLRPGKCGRPACAAKARVRIMALWPQ